MPLNNGNNKGQTIKPNGFDAINIFYYILGVMAASNNLHKRVNQVRDRINPMSNVINYPSNNLIPYPKQDNYAIPSQEETQPETVFINMKIDPEEDLETKYVYLFIDTKPYVNL
ncbi:unnamed protein product [Rotaria sp. Silwood1]|nr:unnamed protein product [Rotaria sp. Silwood1]CAF4820591.1 unnamed protein product [Rotaria sp. Silwood1]CAF4860242.1 unnamed protein product [Rotaria sp. Silwood1]